MTHYIVEKTLASAVADNGTFTVTYPTDTVASTFHGATAHKMTALGAVYSAPGDFTVSFTSESIITVTYLGATTLPEGTKIRLQLAEGGADDSAPTYELATSNTEFLSIGKITLGAPEAADTDAFIKAATGAELPDGTPTTVTYTPDTDGTSPTDGVGPVVTIGGVNYWEMDVPRNIMCTTTHDTSIVAMTITASGLDEYGVAMTENISVAATGTSEVDVGKKAFKWVRSILITVVATAVDNTLNVGFGEVLGLPVALPEAGLVLGEMEDGAAPTAGVIVAADATTATATTGDVRGTYTPDSAPDGDLAFALVAALPDWTERGVAQA